MDRLLKYCMDKRYSSSLTNFLIELFKTYSSNATVEEQQNFIDAITNTNIILVDSYEAFISVIKDKLRKEIGYEMSKLEEIGITYVYRQKGIYLPIPNTSSNSVSRMIVVRTSKNNEIITDEDKVSLSHELFHLLRSFGSDEIIKNDNEINIKSGLKRTTIPVSNGNINYFNGKRDNERSEEKFVSFLGEKYNILVDMNINTGFDALHEIVNSGERFNNLPGNDKNEILSLYLNLLILSIIYKGKVSSCLNSANADFLSIFENIYGDKAKQLFKSIYDKEFYDESILKELEAIFNPSLYTSEVGQLK